MPTYESDDEEEWYDDEDDGSPESDASESGHCPECAGPVYEFSDRCPACGYWLTAADRRRLWSSESKPKWVLLTAAVILAILVLGALTLNF